MPRFSGKPIAIAGGTGCRIRSPARRQDRGISSKGPAASHNATDLARLDEEPINGKTGLGINPLPVDPLHESIDDISGLAARGKDPPATLRDELHAKRFNEGHQVIGEIAGEYLP